MALGVKYSINGVDFETNEAYVSQSHGLIDIPDPKPVLSHEWPDENGTVYDLEEAPKFKERHIALDMFFTGKDWATIKANFDTIMSEFDNEGTQTLKVKPFEHTTLEFEVILREGVTLQKTFRDERMFGICTLNLTEPEPNVF